MKGSVALQSEAQSMTIRRKAETGDGYEYAEVQSNGNVCVDIFILGVAYHVRARRHTPHATPRARACLSCN